MIQSFSFARVLSPAAVLLLHPLLSLSPTSLLLLFFLTSIAAALHPHLHCRCFSCEPQTVVALLLSPHAAAANPGVAPLLLHLLLLASSLNPLNLLLRFFSEPLSCCSLLLLSLSPCLLLLLLTSLLIFSEV